MGSTLSGSSGTCPPAARATATTSTNITPVTEAAVAAYSPGVDQVAHCDNDDTDDKLCRYCFEGDEAGELIAPCRCAGGQKWVHLCCLRRWQRGVLVSQPTHPDYYDDDLRHRVCGVCKSPFTCRPPTRLELMQSFTGEELAALVEERCIIGTHKNFSAEMRRQVAPFPMHLRQAVMDSHWIDGVFLIVKVVQDRGVTMRLRIEDKEDLQTFASTLSEDWCWQLRGRLYRLIFDGPLETVAEASDDRRRAAIRSLPAPCTLKLSPTDEGDSGEDGIMAVNLTRPVDLARDGSSHVGKHARFQTVLKKALPDGMAFIPSIIHFVGGPCHESRVQFAIVTCGTDSYKVYTRLAQAIVAAQELCSGESLTSGAAAQSNGALSDGEDDEPNAATAGAIEGRRPAKRRREEAVDSDDASTAPSSAANSFTPTISAGSIAGGGSASQHKDVRLLVFWGAAGWSRCQLMGEIASGSWGLCKANVQDVTVTSPENLYETMYPRLVFAPKTEMSEAYDQVERQRWANEAGHAADVAAPADRRMDEAAQDDRDEDEEDSVEDDSQTSDEEASDIVSEMEEVRAQQHMEEATLA